MTSLFIRRRQWINHSNKSVFTVYQFVAERVELPCGKPRKVYTDADLIEKNRIVVIVAVKDSKGLVRALVFRPHPLFP